MPMRELVKDLGGLKEKSLTKNDQGTFTEPTTVQIDNLREGEVLEDTAACSREGQGMRPCIFPTAPSE